MRQVTLLTGAPGSGKTTMIQRVLVRLSVPAGGSYTQEVREKGTRTGFELVTLDGRRAILAHVNIHSRKRVGKYGVNLAVLDALAVTSIQEAANLRKIVVIDEIGPMEILSERFRDAVMHILQSDATVLGTIAERSIAFTDQIKILPGLVLIQVRLDNRDALLEQIVAQMTNR